MLKNFLIGPFATQFAFILRSPLRFVKKYDEINLYNYNDILIKLENNFQNGRYELTDILTKPLFTQSLGSRASAGKYLILFVVEKFYDSNEALFRITDFLEKNSINVIVVGVGKMFDIEQAKILSVSGKLINPEVSENFSGQLLDYLNKGFRILSFKC